jgi:hypothetical protein
MNPSERYARLLTEAERRLNHLKQRIWRISMLRVLLFAAGIAALIYFFHAAGWLLALTLGCTFIPFLVLVKVHNRLFWEKTWTETEIRIYQEELQALQGNYSAFDGGKECVNPSHEYSYDLDLFGERSLFQSLNRTCTCFGKHRLAAWFQRHLTDKNAIEDRQQCITDLSKRPDFRERFRTTGLVNQGNDTDREMLRQWCDTPVRYLHRTWVKTALWAVPLLNALTLLGGLSGICSFQWFGLTFMGCLIISFGFIKRATQIQETYGSQLHTLKGYARLLAQAEAEPWEAPGLQALTRSLYINGKAPTEALNELSKELDRLDLRNNQFLYVILEGLMFFQLQEIVRIERWKSRYGKYIMGWMEAIGTYDALCSLGTFAYNHPQYTYPRLTDTPFCFLAQDMGHPLMPESQCVKNDAYIPSRPFFLIITGANMAGKSTYLRTIGVNYLLACIGAPVCCSSLTLYPSRLITSLRTSDSLSDNESYFFAELKRLKHIIDLLNEGEELFIILDEILKGTNSMDKQKGSFDLIRQFMQLKANGIIATHDLLLGKLIEQFPDEIRNYCFEADITGDELTFSYRLREGIAQNMNACFLMKKMGIILQE